MNKITKILFILLFIGNTAAYGSFFEPSNIDFGIDYKKTINDFDSNLMFNNNYGSLVVNSYKCQDKTYLKGKLLTKKINTLYPLNRIYGSLEIDELYDIFRADIILDLVETEVINFRTMVNFNYDRPNRLLFGAKLYIIDDQNGSHITFDTDFEGHQRLSIFLQKKTIINDDFYYRPVFEYKDSLHPNYSQLNIKFNFGLNMKGSKTQ